MAQSIGDRIAALREFRDLTQEQLASRAGVCVDTIRKLEQGRRQSARISTLRSLARALDTELEQLLGQPTVTQTVSDEGGLIALRDAIQDVGALPGVVADADPEDPPSATAWMEAVGHATCLYWAGGYSELARTLPLVLRDGEAVARDASAGTADRVWQRLALAYQLAASLATQAGHTSWAFQAVQKQLVAAGRASDPLMEGMGVSTLSWVLLRQGRWEQAQQVAERKADALEPGFRKATKTQLAVYGNLLLAAATPAARRNQRDEAEELLNLAETAATRSGPVRAYGTAFSTTDVATQQVNVALAGDSPRPDRALALSRAVDPASISRPVHSASHRLDVSQAKYRTGDSEGALTTLLEVEAEQPEWFRFQTMARSTVQEMLEDERRRNTELRALAHRLGLDPAL
ncbi:helix-turn-helix domain-containing protein [Streptomyces sparsus]